MFSSFPSTLNPQLVVLCSYCYRQLSWSLDGWMSRRFDRPDWEAIRLQEIQWLEAELEYLVRCLIRWAEKGLDVDWKGAAKAIAERNPGILRDEFELLRGDALVELGLRNEWVDLNVVTYDFLDGAAPRFQRWLDQLRIAAIHFCRKGKFSRKDATSNFEEALRAVRTEADHYKLDNAAVSALLPVFHPGAWCDTVLLVRAVRACWARENGLTDEPVQPEALKRAESWGRTSAALAPIKGPKLPPALAPLIPIRPKTKAQKIEDALIFIARNPFASDRAAAAHVRLSPGTLSRDETFKSRRAAMRAGGREPHRGFRLGDGTTEAVDN